MALVDANRMEENDGWQAAVPNDVARAEYFAAMETGAPYGRFAGDAGVGVRGGAQDPIAIVCAEAGHVTQFKYKPARLERRVVWPGEYVMVIAVSGVGVAPAKATIEFYRARKPEPSPASYSL